MQIDDQPVLKRSEDIVKLINPGFQITYRIIQGGAFKADVTCLRGGPFEKKILAGEEFTIRAEFDDTRHTTYKAGSYEAKPLQVQVIKNGVATADTRSILERRQYYLDNLSALNPTQKRLINPHYYKVDISDDLYDLKMNIINNIIKEIDDFCHSQD